MAAQMDKKDLGIRYLAFEGGGGRGAAYLGAIQCLEGRQVIKWGRLQTSGEAIYGGSRGEGTILDPTAIKGVAGTSAGAITAALLAAGKDDKFFFKFLTSDGPNKFFDNPKPLKCPYLPMKAETNKDGEKVGNFNPDGYGPGLRLVENVSSFAGELKGLTEETLFNKILGLVAKMEFSSKCGPLALLYGALVIYLNSRKEFVLKKINNALFPYVFSFYFDMGLFTGIAIRDWIDKCLEEQTGIKNITFAQFNKLTTYPNVLVRVPFPAEGEPTGWTGEALPAKHNGIHLKIAGVCLNTAEVVWFDHLGPWRDMPIADAVRISMGIPGVFKPVAIPLGVMKQAIDLEQDVLLFVDGGVLNNLPIHAFDGIDQTKDRTITMAESLLFGGGVKYRRKIVPLNKEMLGLRLTDPSEWIYSKYGNGLSMISGVLDALLSQSEKTQIRTLQEGFQTVNLNTKDLSLLEFAIDSTKMTELCKRTLEQTGEFLDTIWPQRLH